ncbi:MAG TPA: hypothetical protein VMG12_42725 [Polyangiaceae bacterium]|nr:hypothetical protein [Polyangiaceae bacterium]
MPVRAAHAPSLALPRRGQLFTCPVLLLLLGCGELPGTEVGTYRVTMKLEENTCGESAVHLLDGHRYSVQLRSDEKHGYWRIPGQPPLEGSYDAPRFSFESTGVVATEGPDAGPRGCALRQLDRLTGELTGLADAGNEEPADASEELDAQDELDGGSELVLPLDEDAQVEQHDTDDESALRGEHVFTISAVAGNDCRVALVPKGGFERLPCSVRYAIRGVPIKSF